MRSSRTTREERLREVLAEHRGILVRISRAYANGPGPDDAEDLLQEILLALWRALPGFRGESKVSTWAYRVALNTALCRQRATGRRPASVPLDSVPEPVDDRAWATDERLRWSAVLDGLRRVPEVDRAVLLLALEGATQREIAEVLGITPGNAGVRLHRARRRLSSFLESTHELR